MVSIAALVKIWWHLIAVLSVLAVQYGVADPEALVERCCRRAEFQDALCQWAVREDLWPANTPFPEEGDSGTGAVTCLAHRRRSFAGAPHTWELNQIPAWLDEVACQEQVRQCWLAEAYCREMAGLYPHQEYHWITHATEQERLAGGWQSLASARRFIASGYWHGVRDELRSARDAFGERAWFFMELPRGGAGVVVPPGYVHPGERPRVR